MKKILFLCTDHLDLYKVFQKGIEKYSNCDVTTITYKKFKYKNLAQRIQNFLSKLLFNKNLKPLWSSKETIASINKNTKFDYVLIICPEFLHPKYLEFFNTISKKTIAYYWDGFDHFPTYRDTVQYFDICYSFDPVDVKNYNLKFITNFYFIENRNTETKTDFFFLSSYDSRYTSLEEIVSLLEEQNQKIKVYQYTDDKNVIDNNKNKSITFINKYISFEDTTQFMKESKIILDIHKKIQHGLSFRVFEAMGLGKKLITTNEDIMNYDFYNPNNIFIWKKGTKSIPNNFLNTPYEELPIGIYEKYSQKNWVKKVFDL